MCGHCRWEVLKVGGVRRQGNANAEAVGISQTQRDKHFREGLRSGDGVAWERCKGVRSGDEVARESHTSRCKIGLPGHVTL